MKQFAIFEDSKMKRSGMYPAPILVIMSQLQEDDNESRTVFPVVMLVISVILFYIILKDERSSPE